MTYVMSDIHGNGARFKSVMQKIKLQPTDTLYILGDVVDRYPDGIKLIRKFMGMPNVKMLLGNHEYMMLETLYNPVPRARDDEEVYFYREKKKRQWYNNGGWVTHNYLKHIRKELRQEVFAFLSSLPLNISVEVNGQKFLLIHGGVAENYPSHAYRYDNEKEYAVWSRHSRHEHIDEDTILIFGHTPTNHFQNDEPMRMWKRSNYIGIDCGAGYDATGRLCCLRLEDMKAFYSDM